MTTGLEHNIMNEEIMTNNETKVHATDIRLMHPIIEEHLKTLTPQEVENFEDELVSVFLECIAEEMDKESEYE
jgi:hypothetical protein